MNMLFKFAVVWLLLLLVCHPLHARIIGVLTESSATATIDRVNVDGEPRVANYSGAQISESFEAVELGAAAIFDTTSRIGEGIIEFQNGNASYGEGTVSVSRTVVDVSFENTGTERVRPTLNSQITPAGLGIYVSGCYASDLRDCELRDDGDYDWQDVGNNVAPGEAAVGSRFDFRVVSGADVLYELSGGLSLMLGENGNPNMIVQDFSAVEGVLTNFRQTSPFGTQQQISFDWGATDFEVEFPEVLTLDPGEVGTVSYITEVTTFSKAFCYDTGRLACPIAYGSFGDPIGRGGASGSRPPSTSGQLLARQLFSLQSADDSSIDGLDFGTYEFSLPTFENGQLGYRAISGPGITQTAAVPEPAHFALFVLGILGIVLYRIRQLS